MGRSWGPAIAGALVWTLFERLGELVCAMEPVALIETEEPILRPQR